ncbi:MAG: AAA family ATPase [Solirubrobacteraceae bacterium]
MDKALVKAVRLRADEPFSGRSGYPWDLPAVAALADGLRLHKSVTYLIGENGSGKSTLLEAIAVAAAINPEGGSSNFAFSTRDSNSEIAAAIQLIRGVRRPKTPTSFCALRVFSPRPAMWKSSLTTHVRATRSRRTVASRYTSNRTGSRVSR